MVVTDQQDTIYAGNVRVQKYVVTDEDAPGSPPKDLTGLLVKYAVAQVDSSGNVLTTNPLIEKNSDPGGGITITDPANGELSVELDPADTANLPPTDYYFELEVFDGSGGSPVVVATGTLTVEPNVENS